MGFKCGIVGLPNVGKSTLFNALTKANVASANYPFCTIEPNVGVVPVPDLRLQAINDIMHSKQIIPTFVEFVDIAGLVKGASQGEGLGNQFLGHIRETQAIAQVVRCFSNDDVVHVAGNIDPIDDINTINTELILADIETVEKALLKINKLTKTNDKQAILDKNLLENLLEHLNNGKSARTFDFNKHCGEIPSFIKNLHLITIKPILYLANIGENEFTNNANLAKVEQYAQQEKAIVIPICATLESEIAQLDEIEKKAFLEALGLQESGLDRVIRAGYDLLNLQTYFTAGPKEIHAWTITKGTLAPQSAGVIHTDFEKGFIRAEVIAYEDFIKHNGEQGAKEAGLLRLEGKEYVVQDGDIMHFRFNV